LANPQAVALRVPVIAYRGFSDVRWTVPRPGVVRLTNRGTRCGFVLFFSPEEYETAEFSIEPRDAVIAPGGSATFRIGGLPRVALHHGDEILRQILAVLAPDAEYAELESGVLRSEIKPLEAILDAIDSEAFTLLFTDYVKSASIPLGEEKNETAFAAERELDFGDVAPNSESEMILTIENPFLEAVTVYLESDCRALSFPGEVALRGDERGQIPIRIDVGDASEVDALLTLRVGEIQQNVAVRARVAMDPDFEAELLNFGVCHVGRLSRGILRLLNKKADDSIVSISVPAPFLIPEKKVLVKSKCFVFISVHFLPRQEGSFHERMTFKPNNSWEFTVSVLGSAVARF
jgi:hypothetical protein